MRLSTFTALVACVMPPLGVPPETPVCHFVQSRCDLKHDRGLEWAWRRHVLSLRASPVSEHLGREPRGRFIGYLEGLLGVGCPPGFERCLFDAIVDEAGGIFPPSDIFLQVSDSRNAGTRASLDSQAWVIYYDGARYDVPESSRDQHLCVIPIAVSSNDATFVALPGRVAGEYRLLAFDSGTQSLRWEAPVMAEREQFQAGLHSGALQHYVELVMAGDSVVVFGVGNGIYVEVFDGRSGERTLRFCSELSRPPSYLINP